MAWPDALVTEIGLNPGMLCRIFTITLLDGTELDFTDHDTPVTVDGKTYTPNSSFQPSAIQNQTGGTSANLELTCALGTDGFSYADMVLGRPNGASVYIAVASWGNPDAGKGTLFDGLVSSIALPSNVEASLTCIGSGTGNLGKPLTEVYSPACRADLGDARCTVNMDALKVDFAVSGITDDMTFTCGLTNVDGAFNLGQILWTSGNNEGQAQEVAISLHTGAIQLFYPPVYALVVGDTGTIWPGCDKTVYTCLNTYNNLENFRGEPYVPGGYVTS